MSTVLDTHVLVWLLQGNERLGPKSRDLIRAAAQSKSLFVAAMTPWEIAMLASKGRLTFAQGVGQWLKTALALPDIQIAPLSIDISVASTQLAGDFHADPADRIIVATARHINPCLWPGG